MCGENDNSMHHICSLNHMVSFTKLKLVQTFATNVGNFYQVAVLRPCRIAFILNTFDGSYKLVELPLVATTYKYTDLHYMTHYI